MPRRLLILGSTGSIGTQALEVVERLNHDRVRAGDEPRFEIVALAAGANAALLRDQAAKFHVRHTALAKPTAAFSPTFTGPDAAFRLVHEVECDLVLAAMVGVAGLPATLAAVELGRDVALANKETLVSAGALVIAAARRSGAALLPVDSEHSAIWQCLNSPSLREGAGGWVRGVSDHPTRSDQRNDPHPPPSSTTNHADSPALPRPYPPFLNPSPISRVILTASGGPFRTWRKSDIDAATPAQALNHPTWRMGPKVTIDSASLTNKALEIIEAKWLFDLAPDQIHVLIHPQSLVHAIVEFRDGSSLAQLGAPDMRTPIQYALAFPDRPPGPARRLDWSTFSRLDFEPPDHERFPTLRLAYDVLRRGETAGAIFNAANEAAVEAFLAADGRLPFARVAQLVARATAEVEPRPLRSLDDALDADRRARAFVRAALER